MGAHGRALGTSSSSVKRRRARYRAAGIDLASVPEEYIIAPDAVRSRMVALGEVHVAVGALDTSRGVRLTAHRVVAGKDQGYGALPTSHLLWLAQRPSTSGTALTSLAAVAEGRPDGRDVLLAVCAHPACSDALLRRLVSSAKSTVAVVACLERVRRGANDWDDLAELSESRRALLACEGPVEAAARMVSDASSRVRRVLAARALGFAPSMVLATDSDPEVRIVLAQHSTNGRVLEWLRSDRDPRVRALVRFSGVLLFDC